MTNFFNSWIRPLVMMLLGIYLGSAIAYFHTVESNQAAVTFAAFAAALVFLHEFFDNQKNKIFQKMSDLVDSNYDLAKNAVIQLGKSQKIIDDLSEKLEYLKKENERLSGAIETEAKKVMSERKLHD